jgi:hypothetical protein
MIDVSRSEIFLEKWGAENLGGDADLYPRLVGIFTGIIGRNLQVFAA